MTQESFTAAPQASTETVSLSVVDVRPVAGKAIYAFVDVEISIAGVSIVVNGIQIHNLKPAGTAIKLPTYRDERGATRACVSLPDEIREKIADLLIDYLVEIGVSKRRFG